MEFIYSRNFMIVYQESHVLLNKARATARGLIAEMAYMALVGTTVVPPFGVLRRPLVKLISPEILSALALRLAGDDRTISLNSSLGIRLGGMPACGMLYQRSAELGLLCNALVDFGDRPAYEVVDVIPSFGIVLSNINAPEGDLLIAAYRAAEGWASDVEYARLFKTYDKWRLYASIAPRSGRTT